MYQQLRFATAKIKEKIYNFAYNALYSKTFKKINLKKKKINKNVKGRVRLTNSHKFNKLKKLRRKKDIQKAKRLQYKIKIKTQTKLQENNKTKYQHFIEKNRLTSPFIIKESFDPRLVDPQKVKNLTRPQMLYLIGLTMRFVDGRQFYQNKSLKVKKFIPLHKKILDINILKKIGYPFKPWFSKYYQKKQLSGKKRLIKYRNRIIKFNHSKFAIREHEIYVDNFDQYKIRIRRKIEMSHYIKKTKFVSGLRKFINGLEPVYEKITPLNYLMNTLHKKFVFYPNSIKKLPRTTKYSLNKNFPKLNKPLNSLALSKFEEIRQTPTINFVFPKPKSRKLALALLSPAKIERLAYGFLRYKHRNSNYFERLTKRKFLKNKKRFRRRFLYKFHYRSSIRKLGYRNIKKFITRDFKTIHKGFRTRLGLNHKEYFDFFKNATNSLGRNGNLFTRFSYRLQSFLPYTLKFLQLSKKRNAIKNIAEHGHIFINNKIVTNHKTYLNPGDLLTVSQFLYQRREMRIHRKFYWRMVTKSKHFVFMRKLRFTQFAKRIKNIFITKTQLYVNFLKAFPKIFKKIVTKKLYQTLSVFKLPNFYFSKKLKAFLFSHQPDLQDMSNLKTPYNKRRFKFFLQSGLRFN